MNSSNFTHTDVNEVNDNIQIIRHYGNNSNMRSRRVIILPTENIVYQYIEGPFGSYDNDNPIEIWHLCIEIDRTTASSPITIRLEYRTYIIAEEVLHKINNYLY